MLFAGRPCQEKKILFLEAGLGVSREKRKRRQEPQDRNANIEPLLNRRHVHTYIERMLRAAE
jgi:hypothetical protein